MLSILTHIICTVILVYFFIDYIKKSKALKGLAEGHMEELTDEQIGQKLKQAFDTLHLKYWTKEDDEKCMLHVDYQNAHFIINYKNAVDQGVDIIYPFFYKERTDYIDAVRSFCNRINSYHSPIVTSYLPNDDYLYINASTNLSPILSVRQIEQEFVQRASIFFSYQREITTTLIEEIKKVKQYEVTDIEYNDCCDEKMKQLLLESTIHAEKDNFILPDTFLHHKNTLTLEDLLKGLQFLEPDKLTRMEVITGYNIFNCDMPEKIRTYKVCTPLLGCEHPDETIQDFVHDEAVFKLYYLDSLQPDSSHPAPERVLYIMLKAAQKTPQTLFYKATVCLPEKHLANIPQISFHESLHDQKAITLLLGYDIVTPNQQKAEFDFMYKDIEDKIAEGDSKDLSPEQLLIFGISNPDAAFYAYWGKRFVRQERYLEAAIRFNQAWNRLSRDFDNLKKIEKQTFYEISSLIGFCLYKLNMPKTALYFYHLASEVDNSHYFCMLIKCMIASNDPTCMKHIDNSLNETISQMAEIQEEEEEIPEMLTHIYHFLRRSKVQVYFQHKMLDEAEELCKELTKDNENSDFALTYLKLIQKERENM